MRSRAVLGSGDLRRALGDGDMSMSAVPAGGEGATYLLRHDKNPERVSTDVQVKVRADVRELTFNENVAARDARPATSTTRA